MANTRIKQSRRQRTTTVEEDTKAAPDQENINIGWREERGFPIFHVFARFGRSKSRRGPIKDRLVICFLEEEKRTWKKGHCRPDNAHITVFFFFPAVATNSSPVLFSQNGVCGRKSKEEGGGLIVMDVASFPSSSENEMTFRIDVGRWGTHHCCLYYYFP